MNSLHLIQGLLLFTSCMSENPPKVKLTFTYKKTNNTFVLKSEDAAFNILRHLWRQYSC